MHVSFLIDRSGSMSGLQGDVVGGFNSFVANQRNLPGGCRLTAVQFDGQNPYEVFRDGVDIGAEVYNTYGPANDLLPVSQQGHLAGPFVSLPLNESLTLRTSALVGLTAGSTDATFRVFLTQRF